MISAFKTIHILLFDHVFGEANGKTELFLFATDVNSSMVVKKKVAKKTVKKTVAKKTATRQPTLAAMLKKIAAVSDSTKEMSKEIRLMTKIFSDNQRILVSMKSMIDSLTVAIEQVQKQSKQMNILEEDTQKLFASLSQVRAQSGMIGRINDQAARLQEQVRRIEQEAKSTGGIEKVSQKVSESMDSIKNNSQMIINMARRIDGIKEDLKKVSDRAESVPDVSSEIGSIKADVQRLVGNAGKTETIGEDITLLKGELQRLSQKAESAKDITREMADIKRQISDISAGTENINSLRGAIEGIKQQFKEVSNKTESLASMAEKVRTIESDIRSISEQAGSIVTLDKSIKSVEADFAGLKGAVLDRTESIEQKVSSLADMVGRSDASASEFHKKTDAIFQELHGVKSAANKASSDSSKEMMALLKLSEYQSNMRMNAESKYGEAKNLDDMASQTAQIVNLFDKLSVETQDAVPLPHETRQWAVAKILDCADKWEVRFSDVLSILTNNLGRDMIKESIRIRQVRDIYGIRAVDEIRNELGMS